MLLILDIVDLLQLDEIWSRRPVVTAFTRLEERPDYLNYQFNFQIEDLIPRLSRLKRSEVWRMSRRTPADDPARLPLGAITAEQLTELYPEADALQQRQTLFQGVYSRYVLAHYRGGAQLTGDLLHALSDARYIDADTCLNQWGVPREGSAEWIPAGITDEVRALDCRYDATEPGLPAAFVVAEGFWNLFLKATPAEYQAAAARLHPDDLTAQAESVALLAAVAEVATMWHRSPSVVGLCYQVPSA
jgi:hypothetical protein